MTVQQPSVQDAGALVLRLGPCIAYGGPGREGWEQVATSVLAWVQERRLRLFTNRRPDPECVLDLPVVSIDLDLTRMPRDRTASVTVDDGSVVRLVTQPGACACQGGSMLRGWAPSS